jgi:hypothetical protein
MFGGLSKLMGGHGIDLFSMMGLVDTGKEVLAFLQNRKSPDVYDTPQITKKEIDGKTIHIIQYTIGYYSKEDAEEFVKADEKLREIQKGFSDVMEKAKKKEKSK